MPRGRPIGLGAGGRERGAHGKTSGLSLMLGRRGREATTLALMDAEGLLVLPIPWRERDYGWKRRKEQNRGRRRWGTKISCGLRRMAGGEMELRQVRLGVKCWGGPHDADNEGPVGGPRARRRTGGASWTTGAMGVIGGSLLPAAWGRGAPARRSKGGGRAHSGRRDDVVGWTTTENKEGGLSDVVGWG